MKEVLLFKKLTTDSMCRQSHRDQIKEYRWYDTTLWEIYFSESDRYVHEQKEYAYVIESWYLQAYP